MAVTRRYHSFRKRTAKGLDSPRRYNASFPIPQSKLTLPISPFANVMMQLAANIAIFTIRIAVVTGASPPKNPDNPLLKAASEKRKFAPHSWHRLALIPTSDPHAGQSFGRG